MPVRTWPAGDVTQWTRVFPAVRCKLCLLCAFLPTSQPMPIHAFTRMLTLSGQDSLPGMFSLRRALIIPAACGLKVLSPLHAHYFLATYCSLLHQSVALASSELLPCHAVTPWPDPSLIFPYASLRKGVSTHFCSMYQPHSIVWANTTSAVNLCQERFVLHPGQVLSCANTSLPKPNPPRCIPDAQGY